CALNAQLAELDATFSCDRFARTALASDFYLADVFAMRFLRELCRELCRQEPDFLEFRGENLEALRKELGQLMEEVRSAYCKLIASMAPDPNAVHSVNARRVGDKRGLALLRHVGEKTKARVTARELIHRAGEALNEFCPCFLMTPSSVADYLPPGHTFDLLLIDEASQMLVEEAAGSVLRSKQLVVVGDRQQMPPTRYMVSTLDVPDDEDKDESILERSSLALPSKRRLLYHYRSEDENLIAFSNHEFYDGELLTIPNLREDSTLGVHLVRAGGIYESGKDGCSRDPNPIEAERVVALILEHVHKFPDRSLGVAVLNLRQATRIEELFNEQVAKDPAIAEFLNQWQGTPEYFFIKNLDNVQGDERDVILIATVFGKNGEGKVYQRFGPISQPMGENRINVLITRSKKRVIVCTSLEPNDLSLNREGPQVLSRYLSYAATGDLPGGAQIDSRTFSAPYEKWFHDRLEADGYEVDPQVGVSGWRVNLGVKHPDQGKGYLCGIELDGPSYHLAPGARDRDVGRHFILEAKGWTIIRVWSIDFFH
ncbi:MAG: AAA domain-containing protein, partial [Opitutales bacterium]